MVKVAEAEAIIQGQCRDFGAEIIPFDQALGRVLAEDLQADRDFPPFNRVTMDGIAIQFQAFEKGNRSFKIKATQAAGEPAKELQEEADCIEIMTGAVLPQTTDTVIRYEDLEIQNGVATLLTENIKAGQNIHRQGKDKRQGGIVASANQVITPALMNVAASVGATEIKVKKLPRVVVLSTGDELVEVHEKPQPYQIRKSNSYTIQAALQQFKVLAELRHLPDNPEQIRTELLDCLKAYDVILLSGGISKGKFDYVPEVLSELQVETLFQHVQQRPGKPFWFGKHPHGALVFAFPGNPVSTFMCLYRYFFPWLKISFGLDTKKFFACLSTDFTFKPELQYFLQVKLQVSEQGKLVAEPVEGNGSGDLTNLVDADAFLELPAERTHFQAGEVFRVWPFKQLF
ncbi:molybdopterin molybdotransferase MoeA [Adhaeribacter soli]|uniref:Molybdopterin molybdenumtransferase n=1 Tax=Adhaeribacter soli TaxID=2607655 RepID=A0A5N1J7Z0_9BACT|nr:molybdopterin molybdotransferase MoeA [Adhaeribacter soli]KAA9346092.1 molybdopterin molybdotransferase MoeA [Adhaeribacter soli]